ncbi:MAG: hypothetical protein KC516_00485 [Nanoarchaeota archaeon]|nr:hypothetical protein [Nanoarchaeota archaeon]
MRNKKSNIPIIFFVLGVFLVCSFALLTFFISDFQLSNSFVGLSVVENLNYNLEEYNFYVNQNILLTRVDEFLNVSSDAVGRYLYGEKVVKGERFFSIKNYLD